MRVTIAVAVTALTVFVVSAGAYVTSASAATGHVSNCDSSGPGSLPDTVTAAGSGDTIVFDQDCAGPSAIVLSSAISISGTTLTIDATGYAVTISGNDSTQIFTVQSTGTLTLAHLTLTRGSAPLGGAIKSEGSLTVQDSTLSE